MFLLFTVNMFIHGLDSEAYSVPAHAGSMEGLILCSKKRGVRRTSKAFAFNLDILDYLLNLTLIVSIAIFALPKRDMNIQLFLKKYTFTITTL